MADTRARARGHTEKTGKNHSLSLLGAHRRARATSDPRPREPRGQLCSIVSVSVPVVSPQRGTLVFFVFSSDAAVLEVLDGHMELRNVRVGRTGMGNRNKRIIKVNDMQQYCRVAGFLFADSQLVQLSRARLRGGLVSPGDSGASSLVPVSSEAGHPLRRAPVVLLMVTHASAQASKYAKIDRIKANY